MEVETEGGGKVVGFRVKAASRELATQKAVNVLEADLRSHWSTATNTKEWILLELHEPCLLSHIRIYNKSVLEWEIAAGLRYKPEAFVKVRPRCEAPKRDMMYPTNYTPCRYVRISCLRGNPIAIFFIQLIGVPVPGLEPELQPVVNYLLPHITSHKQDSHNMHLQLIQDMASRLPPFLTQIEADLTSVTETPESTLRFLAMLAGPFYPILQLINERDVTKTLVNSADSDALKNSQASTPTISSNFEAQPRRSRSPSFVHPASCMLAFRSETAILLLRKAHKEKALGIVCRRASKVLQKLLEPALNTYEPTSNSSNQVYDEIAKSAASSLALPVDYSSLFGEEFSISENHFDDTFLNILDIAAVEEGILHVLYAAASQPLLCCKLAEITSDMSSVLPLIQALLPALRPPPNPGHIEQIDDSFCQWNHPTVRNALSQIVTMSVSSSVFHPLLRACAGYLSSYLPSHARAACILVDLCRGPLSPWIPTITVKVDLAIELLEDLLGVIQGASQSISRSRSALKYVILAISGHMDDVLPEYKEVKHNLLFLLEMLDPFVDPSLSVMKDTIAFGGVNAVFLEKQQRICSIALNIIRTAVKRPAVLPSLELEWQRGAVAPSVLLSVLDPHMPLPPEVDFCKSSATKIDQASFAVSNTPTAHSCNRENFDGKDSSETTVRAESFEECNSLFAPEELKQSELMRTSTLAGNIQDNISAEVSQNIHEGRKCNDKFSAGLLQLDDIVAADCYNAQADYLQLVNHQDCELRALEFERLALDLCMQQNTTTEGHNAGIDALLLAAECYVNPFFLMAFRPNSKPLDQFDHIHPELIQGHGTNELKKDLHGENLDLATIYNLENKRDMAVLDLLLRAAKFDREYQEKIAEGKPYPNDIEDDKQSIEISPEAIQFVDAVTLVRKNQAMLFHFVMKQFQREGHLSNEILLQSLLFLLHSATDLFVPPENVIDIILHSAENLNGQLTYLYNQVNERGNKLDTEKLHIVQRRWALLQKLVLASSGSDNGREPVSIKRDGFRFRSLVPPSAWMQKIPEFSRFSSPLPRFLGWMAVSRYAKEYLNERLFLASDFLQLTSLLSLFMDELALMDGGVTHKVKSAKIEPCDSKNYLHVKKETAISDRPDSKCVFQVMLPDLHFFFPSMSKLFRSFGETILGAVGLQLKCFPNSAVQDVLCWFSEMCLWPYLETIKEHLVVANSISCLRGNIAANAKAVVFYLLESVVAEHLEAIVPEMPRLVHILVSLCRASYTDVAFLESVLCLVKPLISYFLRKRTNDERLLSDITECNDFDLLGFDELFEIIQCGKQANDTTRGKIQIPLLIFMLGSLFPDLPFTKKVELFDSLLMWIDFINSDPPSSLCSYIQGFQMFIDGCEIVLVQNMELLGIDILSARGQCTESASSLSVDGSTQLEKQLSYNAEQVLIKSGEYHYNGENCKGVDSLPIGCIKEFCDGLERFISHLIPSIEASWKWHHLLASKLSLSVAKCLLFAKCLEAITQEGTTGGGVLQDVALKVSGECAQKHWGSALEDLAGIILISQENQCWQVASAMLDYMLKLPDILAQGDVLSSICSAIKHFCFHAPRVSWRLQTEKWLSLLVSERLRINDISLVDLFCKMLSHAEPEQRSVALQQLGRTVSLTSNIEVDSGPCTDSQNLPGSSLADTSILVTQTWDRVAALVLYDPSMLLRRHAMAVLTEFVPFVDRNHLRSFLASSNIILNGVGKLSNTIEEGHLTRMSLMLLCRACLYSPSEDISLIPECVWRKLEDMRISITGGVGDMEKDLCRALCQLRTESDAKTAVKEISLSGSTAKPIDPCFKSIRESILQVLSSLSTVESYFEFFSIRSAQEAQELEEAEIELELIEKERAVQDFVGHPPEAPFPNILSNNKDGNEAYKRLQQIREDIRSLERSRLREEIIARRQKKLLIRHTREKFLEDASSREMELLQNLDRERALETEREIERQRQLDLERVRTRELQFNLDIEREKQNQRELQRELEQIELGRSSRREFSGNANSRSRERYRERDNGRVQQEGSLRSSSRGNDGGTAQVLTPGPNMSSTPTVVLAGSRSFSGNLPTILQSRERSDERGTSYEDNAEGSRDSGDASSIGDPELGSAFDGLGLVTRHGPRGSKSRQVIERREREGRREGKWERKHS